MQDPHGSDARGPRSPTASRRGAVAVLLVLLALLAMSRLWKLEIDPPGVVIYGYSGQAHFRDEAAKAHEARNKAKWDRFSLSEADEYGFWRAQSPAWVWGEVLWFRAFGVGLIQARMFVVVQTLVALALLMWLAWVRHGLPAAIVTGLLLGLNWAYLIYSRLALMEGALICWLLVVTAALAQMTRHPNRSGRWAMVAAVAMLVACTIKQTGLLLVPAFGVAVPLVALHAVGQRAGGGAQGEARRGLRGLVRGRLRDHEVQVSLLAVTVLGLALAMLVFSPEYQERLAFNAAHFTAASEDEVVSQAAETLARGFYSRRIQLMFMRLAPLCMWLATAELARQIFVGLRRRRDRRRGLAPREARGPLGRGPDVLDSWMLAWAVLALLANLASPHRAIRFQLIILPPAAWLAGALVGRVWGQPFARVELRRAVQAAIVGVAVLASTVTVLRFVEWTRYGAATAAWIGDDLRELIGPKDAVVVGEFAAQAVLETDYRHFYVRPHQFNDRAEVIRQLGVTHLAVEDQDFVEALMRSEVPELLVGRQPIGTIRFRERELTVWELADAERRAELQAWYDRQAHVRLSQRRDEARKNKQLAAKRARLERRFAQCLPAELPEDELEAFTKVPPPKQRRPRNKRGKRGNARLELPQTPPI